MALGLVGWALNRDILVVLCVESRAVQTLFSPVELIGYFAMNPSRFDAARLIVFAERVLRSAGLSETRAHDVAEVLVEGDLLGHTTHGLALLPAYVRELQSGGMVSEGEPQIVADCSASATWDGGYLPGPWLVRRGIEWALERAATAGVATLAIRRSHHIACLAAFLRPVAELGKLLLLACSDPRCRSVAPFGGVEGVLSPNPLAIGIPTSGRPILIDVSMSTTANGFVNQCRETGERLPHPWLLSAEGEPTDDPTTFTADPPSTILPLGGIDAGYKGFALGLMIEALTSALAGHGRADRPTAWGASVLLQVIDPTAFGGLEAFARETSWLADACTQSPAISGRDPIRLPGERALALRAEQLREGVALRPHLSEALTRLSEELGIPFK
jgi:L-lactate dehydrogenase